MHDLLHDEKEDRLGLQLDELFLLLAAETNDLQNEVKIRHHEGAELCI